MPDLPPIVLPLIARSKQAIQRPRLPDAFWEIDHGPTILDAFMALALEMNMLPVAERNALPDGYRLLACLFGWEADCQFDGWGAFGNIGESRFNAVCEAYRFVGLVAEAESLQVQMTAYRLNPGNAEALQAAIDSTRHALSGDLDRLEYLTQYLCDHAQQLLYLPEDVPA